MARLIRTAVRKRSKGLKQEVGLVQCRRFLPTWVFVTKIFFTLYQSNFILPSFSFLFLIYCHTDRMSDKARDIFFAIFELFESSKFFTRRLFSKRCCKYNFELCQIESFTRNFLVIQSRSRIFTAVTICVWI